MSKTETVPWKDKEEGDYFQLGGGEALREGGRIKSGFQVFKLNLKQQNLKET